MKNLMSMVVTVVVGFVAAGVSIGEAEARRLGGGSSFGMQRQSVTPKPAFPTRQVAPATPTAPTAAPATAPKRNWMGPVAGLAAGLGIAALLSHFGLGEEMASLLMLALMAMAVFFVVRLLLRRSAPAQTAAPLEYAGAGQGGYPPASEAAPVGTSADQMQSSIPAGFDSEAFLRVAKLNFVRLQAANDATNLDDIREFVTPEVFAEIKVQMDERGNVAQQTDVVTLNAELLEVVTEDVRHIASLRFNGMIRETEGGPAVPFDEIWHLSKPVDDSRGWMIAGIQQRL